MKKILAGFITGLFLLTMVSIADAAIVPVYVPGTGLDWVPFSYTLGMSWGDVYYQMDPGETFYGWRFAQKTEIESLYTAIHPGWGYGWLTANEGIVDEMGLLLGYTSGDGTGLSAINGVSYPKGGAYSITKYMLINQDRYAPANTDDVQNRSFGTGDNGGASPVASYLVRQTTVPVPAAVWLLGSGLVGLVGLRRKLKK